MIKTGDYIDKRLPMGYTVFHNVFDEWVVCDEFGRVAKVDNKNNVRASARKDEAVLNWLNKKDTI